MPLDVDVEVRRGERTIAVSFSVADGETVALVGRNGAGKTTALEAIAGIVPTTGRVVLDGRSLTELPPERRGIGVTFQDAMLFPKLSVLENVAFPLRAGGVGRDAARARAGAVLADLAPAVDPAARPRTLSGGERQRVALARALTAEPRVLLLDEPFASVDAEAKPELRSLLRRTLASFDGPRVLVTHDPVEATTLADRLVLLEDGRVTQTGTPSEVRSRPVTRYAAELVGTNLFEGSLIPDQEGIGILRTHTGELTVVWPDGLVVAAVDDVRATLSPAEIALHTEEPHGSARNVFRGAVEEVATVGGRARIRLRTSPPLVAELTTGSVERLGIVPGRDVWASCKAVEIRLMVPGGEPDTL
jgi:molybdate transport system ATP-binding protein